MISFEQTGKRFPFLIHQVLLFLFVLGILLSVIMLKSSFDPAAKLGVIGTTLLCGYLFVLFKAKDRYLPYILMIPSIATILTVTLIPVCFLVYLSIHDVTLLNFNKGWEFVGLKNFKYFLTEDNLFFPALIRTIEYMIVVLGAQLVIGMGLALLLKKRFWGRSFISTILVIPVMSSPIVVAMLWKYMFSSTNGFINLLLGMFHLPEVHWLTNTPLPLISTLPLVGEFFVRHLNANIGFLSAVIVNIWQWTPFVFLMFLAGLSALPREPYEAAEVDGANAWQTFWSITFPLMKPVISVVVLIRIIDLMKVYDQIWALFGDSVVMRTLNIHIFSVGLTTQNYSKGAALSIIVLTIVIGTYVLFTTVSDWIAKRGIKQ